MNFRDCGGTEGGPEWYKRSVDNEHGGGDWWWYVRHRPNKISGCYVKEQKKTNGKLITMHLWQQFVRDSYCIRKSLKIKE